MCSVCSRAWARPPSSTPSRAPTRTCVIGTATLSDWQCPAVSGQTFLQGNATSDGTLTCQVRRCAVNRLTAQYINGARTKRRSCTFDTTNGALVTGSGCGSTSFRTQADDPQVQCYTIVRGQARRSMLTNSARRSPTAISPPSHSQHPGPRRRTSCPSRVDRRASAMCRSA